jgi:hypothetical protein
MEVYGYGHQGDGQPKIIHITKDIDRVNDNHQPVFGGQWLIFEDPGCYSSQRNSYIVLFSKRSSTLQKKGDLR